MMLRLSRPARDERGFTLVELMTAMALLSIVVTAVMGVLFSVQKAVSFETNRSITNDNVRLAMEALDKEMRSAGAFTVYTNGTFATVSSSIPPTGTAVVVYTQTNAPTRSVSSPDVSGYMCVQWRLNGTDLQSRMWPLTWRSNPSALVTGWMNRAESVQSLSFTVPSGGADTAFGKRLLRTTFAVLVGGSTDSTITTTRDIAGRNVLTTPSSTGDTNPCVTDPPVP